MSRWFRMYDEALDDPKVQCLSAEDFRGWVNLLCVASRNDGVLPEIETIAFALRIDVIGARSLVDRLLIGGLIDVVKGGPNGSRIAPHGWQKRQYKSDTSTARVKRFRQRSETVTVTPPETDTETDNTLSKDNDASVDSDAQFWAAAKAYVGGRNPGALIGKWIRDADKASVGEAITRAQLERPVDRIAFIQGVLRHKRRRTEEAEAYVPIC